MSSGLAQVVAAWRALRSRAQVHRLWLSDDRVCELGKLPALASTGSKVLPSFDAWCAAHPGGRCDILVSDHLLHHFVCDPGLPLSDVGAVREYALQQFIHYHGATAEGWTLAAWTSAVGAGASALHGVRPDELLAAAKRHGVRIRRLAPAWPAVLAWWASQRPEVLDSGEHQLAWVDGALVTVMHLAQGRLVGLVHDRLREGTAPALAQWLAGLRTEWVMKGTVHVFAPHIGRLPAQPDGVSWLGDGKSGSLPWLAPQKRLARRSGLPRPALLLGAASPPRLAWALAVCGVLACTLAAWQAHDAWTARNAARQELAALEARWALVRPTKKLPQELRSAGSGARGLADMTRSLRHPWHQVLPAVEQHGDATVSWLGLDHDAIKGEMILSGTCPSADVALKLASGLASAPGWRDVSLRQFEEAPGTGGLRFEISAVVGAGRS